MVTSADPTAVSESAVRVEPSTHDDPMCRLSAQLRATVMRTPALPGSGKGDRGDREAKPDGSVKPSTIFPPIQCATQQWEPAVYGPKGHPYVFQNDILE